MAKIRSTVTRSQLRLLEDLAIEDPIFHLADLSRQLLNQLKAENLPLGYVYGQSSNMYSPGVVRYSFFAGSNQGSRAKCQALSITLAWRYDLTIQPFSTTLHITSADQLLYDPYLLALNIPQEYLTESCPGCSRRQWDGIWCVCCFGWPAIPDLLVRSIHLSDLLADPERVTRIIRIDLTELD